MKDGSYSIEAAFIMPIAILLVIVFSLLGFFIRDVVFMEAYGRNLLFEMADETVEGENTASLEGLQGSLWYAEVGQFDISEEKGRVNVRYELLPRMNFINIRIEKTLSLDKKEKTAEKIRKWRVITDTAKGLFITED